MNNVPDAERRFMYERSEPAISCYLLEAHSYITNLNPSYILALAETAPFHQVSALRDALWKHIALQTSLRVKLPVSHSFLFALSEN